MEEPKQEGGLTWEPLARDLANAAELYAGQPLIRLVLEFKAEPRREPWRPERVIAF